MLILVVFVAAVLGDSCNYMIGHFFGTRLFSNPDSRIFKQGYLDKTHEFYKKYGGKTIILARFVPIVRTFAPFVAGMGKMHYTYFMAYNVAGGAVWVLLFCCAGYFFGRSAVRTAQSRTAHRGDCFRLGPAGCFRGDPDALGLSENGETIIPDR